MSTPLSACILYSGRTVSAHEVVCRATDSARSREEYSAEDELVFPTAGVFVKHVGGRDVVADAGRVIFFRRGVPYRVSHPACCGDRCIVFRFAPEVLREAVAGFDPKAGEVDGRSVLPVTDGPVDRATYLLQSQFRAAAGANGAGEAAAEELGLRLLDAVLGAALESKGRVSVGSVPLTRRVHRDVADAARLLLAKRFRESLPLSEIAREVHCSPFHLARIFRRETGTSLHRHVTSLRLRHALERLAEGDEDLTGLALELGFSSHAHFSSSFRREFGASPREMRRSLSGARVREISKKLKV